MHRPRLRALVALAPLIWRPDLPLLYVTVIMGVVGPPSASSIR
jgi:hypothetical protein